MKNLKKVLAMVLAFACTFTMFAGAKVFEDVPAGSDYSEAITMLSDLGIIQGKDDGSKYHPEDTITRAEACAMIARLMTGDPNVSQYTGAQNFADVAKGSWKDSAIGYCYINNIVVGVGNNKFEPDRAITDAEFITMVVRAMGYETPDMTQGYPFSYMSNAQAIGLLDGVNMVASTDALRGEDAQVIYNAMFTDYARGAMLVNTTHGTSVESYPTLAESVWGLDRAAVGTWTGKDDEEATLTNCKAHTWVVIGADPSEENHILAYPIDDDTTDLYDSGEKNAYKAYSFKYEGDVESIKGYQVELWGEGSHGEATWEKGEDKFVYSEDWNIKAIKTVKGQTKFDYNPSMADSKDDNGTIELEDTSLDLGSVADNAKHVDVSVGGYRQLFVAKNYNGEAKMDTDKKVEAALNVRDGAQYQLMDWDSDGDVDWVVVDEARYFKVESVSSKRMTVSSMKVAGKSWEESKDSVKDTWKLDGSNDMGKNAAGKTIKVTYEVPDGIEEGDILEVTYTSKFDGDEVVTATVSVIDAESKSLDKVSTKGGLTLTFDDEEIKVAENVEENDVIVPANPATYREFNSEELGTDFDLYLNRNGFIVYSDYTTDRASYAMVLDTKNGGDVLANRGLAKVDLLTADNKHLKGVELTATATINGTSNDRQLNDGAMVGQVYKYWTNDDGQITKMTSVITPANMSANIDASDYRYDADADRLVDNAGKYVASLEDANVIFAVKPNTGSAATNGANFTTVNAGYIQVEDTNSDGVGEDFYVDVDDVLAVKQSDIPDIELSTGTDANTTNANKLDNKTTAATTRARTWLGANNSAGTDYTNTFVAEIDSNGKASAAILGVEDFNKFGAGSTKIALVTDVTYANSTDGKYVELTGAFGGENKTIASTKKVAFGDIVKAYDAGTHTDVTVDNPSAKAAGTLFANVELDKYLEDGAAYAEVTTDGDGNLTKVTFLDYNNYNELAGHYYTVSRNITLGATNKSINYMFNDGTTQSAGSNVYIAKQYYASDSKLYSVPENLAKTNEAFTDDVTFYSIDGAATRGDKNYTGTELTVVDGFQRNPKITAGEDYTVVENSSIDNESNKDSYEVADIARKNNGDVAAVYAFNDSFDEADASGVAIVSMADNTGKAITSAKAGDAVQLTAVVVDSNVAKTLTGVQIVDANGNDVTTAWSAHDSTPTGNNKVYIDTTVTIPASANGKYTIYAVNGTTKYTVGALEVSVTGGVVTMYKVDDMKFKYQDENSDWQDGLQVDAAAQNTFYVGVSGTANGTTPLAAVNNGVSDLTAANFEVLYKGIPSEIYSVTEVAGEPGLYKFVMKNDLPEGQNVTVNVKATGIVNAIDTSMQNGITSVVTTSGSTTAPITFDKVVPLASATSTDVTVGASVKSGSDYYFMLTNKGAGVASDAVSLKKGFDTATVAGDGSGVYKATGASAGVWKILVDGVDTGKTVEFVDAASIALESYSDITVDLLDEVNEEYAVTIKGMKEADLANIKVGKDSLGGTASATDNGITVAYADNKVTVTGTPTAVAAQATFKVGVSGTEADVKVTVSKVTVTAEAVMKDASNMTVTLKKGDAVLTKEQVDKLVSGSDLTTVGNWTLTDDASSQTNPSAVSIEADGTLKVTLKTPLSDSESAGATVTAGTNYKAITVPAATYTQA